MVPFEYIKFRKLDEKAIQMLTTGECFFSSPHHFNDPLDCTHSLEGFPVSLLDEIREEYSKDQFNMAYEFESMIHSKSRRIDYGVMSFCGRYDLPESIDPILNSNLWGHYANNHEGICVGFSPNNSYDFYDFSNALNHTQTEAGRSFVQPQQPGGSNLMMHTITRPHGFDNLLTPTNDAIVKVKYLNNFKLLEPDWEIVANNYRKATAENKKKMKSAEQLMSQLLLNALNIHEVISSKDQCWSSENEFRLLGGKDESQTIGAAISSVTFGLKAKDEAVRYILSIIARFYGPYSMDVYKMIISGKQLIRVPLEMNDGSPKSSLTRISI